MTGEATDIGWAGLFFEMEAKLESAATRRFNGSPDAGAAFNYALEKISANDWERLRTAYGHKGSAAGFLRISFLRLLEDYATAKYGRKVPPVWVRRMGPMWRRVWELLCLQRQLPATIVDWLTADASNDKREVAHAIAQIRARIPDCGAWRGEWNDDALAEDIHQSREPGPDAVIASAEQLTILSVVRGLLHEQGDEPGENAAGQPPLVGPALSTVLEDAVAAIELSTEERLMLRLVYEKGLTITACAKALRLPRKKCSRLHLRLAARLRQALIPLGLGDAVRCDE